jgi:hypothetical protein
VTKRVAGEAGLFKEAAVPKGGHVVLCAACAPRLITGRTLINGSQLISLMMYVLQLQLDLFW